MSAVVFYSSSFWQYLLVIILLSVLLTNVQAQDAGQLALQTRLQKRIATSEEHRYQFPAQAKSYVRFMIHRSTSSIVLGINNAKGQEVASLKCLRCESTSLSVITSETGVYQVSVRSDETGTIIGKYDIELAEVRPTVANDHLRLTAERMLIEGDLLQAKWSAATSQEALDKYRSALRSWQLLGERTGQSVALRAIGNTYSALGEQQKAFESFQQAYTFAGNQARLKARAALGLGFTSIILGQTEKGIEYGIEALTLSKAEQDRSGEAQALLCIGDAHFYLNGQGLNEYENALLAARESDDLAVQARAYSCLGFAITPEKQIEALQYQEKALQLWRLLNDKRGQAITLIALGHLASLTGNKQQALTFYHEAESSIIGCGESDNEARLYAGLGFVQEGLGEQQSALQYYLKALSKWRRAKFRVAEVEALTQIGRLYREMGEKNLALSYLLQAQNMTQALQDSPTEAWVYAHLGLVYADLGRDKDALIAYQEALKSNRNAIPWVRALALNGIGKISYKHKDYKDTIIWYNKALAVNQDAHESFGEVSTLSNIARAERDSGDLDAALKTLNKTIQKIELLRTKMSEPSYRASYFSTTRDAYQLTIDTFIRLWQRSQNHDFLTKSFEVSESARARSLLDILEESKTDLTPTANPELLEEKHSMLNRIKEKNQELAQAYANASTKTQASELEQELAELDVRRKYVESLIRAANPRYASLTQTEPSKLQEIQQLLDTDTALLEYSLGDDQSFLWIITTNSIAVFQLSSQSEIEKIARQVYELLIAPNKVIRGETDRQRDVRLTQAEAKYPQAALRLSQMILAPLASITDKKKLVIVADGALQYIPFAALPNLQKAKNSSDNSMETAFSPLLKQYEIINLPSASTLAAIRRELENRKPATKAVAVIADPVFNKEDAKSRLLELQEVARAQAKTQAEKQQLAARQMEIEGNRVVIDRLLFSREEALAILSIVPQNESLSLLNFQANKQAVLNSDLQQYRCIHFATHGLLNSNHPELSKIVLSLVDQTGKSQDGFLQVHEIYNLKLPVELVVLSACQTALGKEIKGEGLVGLTRGFMYAGAARVIASLWNVNDAATADLMSHFYKYMLQEKQRPAEALRNAQLKMLQQKKWKSPYYWAAFTIQGEWK